MRQTTKMSIAELFKGILYSLSGSENNFKQAIKETIDYYSK